MPEGLPGTCTTKKACTTKKDGFPNAPVLPSVGNAGSGSYEYSGSSREGAGASAFNPCLSCVDTPCCKRLPLERLKVQSRADLETVRKYLLHRWFEVGLKDDGTWMLFYQRPCRNLDPGSGLCTVHGTPQKPWTCKEYPSHHCWYQRVFRTEQSLEFIRFDARRMEILMEMVSYDADTGEIADVPSWEEMIQTFTSCPLDDPSTRGLQGRRKEFRFPVPPPQKERHLALFEFRQNFPGVRILRGKRAWVTVVETYEA